jgi:hypothetical protein
MIDEIATLIILYGIAVAIYVIAMVIWRKWHNMERNMSINCTHYACRNKFECEIEDRPMMYLEYDWTFGVYRPRFGDTFTSVNGWRSYPDLATARAELAIVKLKLGRKTDTRTWKIVELDR